MSDLLVRDCEGIILDSGQGDIAGNYDHNEDYILTICVKEATQISLIFTTFCTEEGFDILRIFDGKDTLAPLIGVPYSGTQSPGVVTSTGDCLTLHFKSDANITCSGWRAQWSVDIDDPLPPNMELSPKVPSCSTKVLTVAFAQKVPCTNIKPESFVITGPADVTVLQASPISCTDDSTFLAQIELVEGLFKSGITMYHS